MYEERQISAGAVTAVGLWVGAVALGAMSLIVWCAFERMGAMMLFAVAAHIVSCAAVVVHIRGYTNKTCRLIRLTASQRPGEREELRAL